MKAGLKTELPMRMRMRKPKDNLQIKRTKKSKRAQMNSQSDIKMSPVDPHPRVMILPKSLKVVISLCPSGSKVKV